MQTKIVDKRKAMILNEEDKILVFLSNRRKNFIKLPGIKSEYDETLPFLGERNLPNYEFITTDNCENINYQVVNGHAVKERIVSRCYYYAMLHTLTDEEKERIISLAMKGDLSPDFLSFKELRRFFESRYYSSKGIPGFIDPNYAPIMELEKRKGIHVLRRDDKNVRHKIR